MNPIERLVAGDGSIWWRRWAWRVVTWTAHGALQALFFWLDPGFGFGMLFFWYYRDRGQHANKHFFRWKMDAIMDVSTPIAVQLILWGTT